MLPHHNPQSGNYSGSNNKSHKLLSTKMENSRKNGCAYRSNNYLTTGKTYPHSQNECNLNNKTAII